MLQFISKVHFKINVNAPYCFRSLNRENLGQSVIQLSISLLIQEVCVLVGFSRGQLGVHPLCVGVAVLSHYFTLSSILWAGITAQHIYKVLAKEYAIQESLFLLKRCTLAWGEYSQSSSQSLLLDFLGRSVNLGRKFPHTVMLS